MFVDHLVGLDGDGDFVVAVLLGLLEHLLDLLHLVFSASCKVTIKMIMLD
jgi:hypothetical protein